MNKECIKCIRCESPKYENGFLTLEGTSRGQRHMPSSQAIKIDNDFMIILKMEGSFTYNF